MVQEFARSSHVKTVHKLKKDSSSGCDTELPSRKSYPDCVVKIRNSGGTRLNHIDLSMYNWSNSDQRKAGGTVLLPKNQPKFGPEEGRVRKLWCSGTSSKSLMENYHIRQWHEKKKLINLQSWKRSQIPN